VERMVEVGLAVLAVLGFVGWLGGGRKWAFRTLLSALVLVGLGAVGIFLYGYVTDKVAEHRAQQIHACAVALVVKSDCVDDPKKAGYLVCPPYILFDNPTPEQESAAVAAAEEKCAGEVDPKQKSLHEQINEYKREHGIKEEVSADSSSDKPKQDWFSENSPENAAKKQKLNSKGCAAKVRGNYPGVYDDLDDATLTKKVLAKYPTYCDVTTSGIDFVPEIKNIR
jgi:hypothetical protein